MQRHQKVLGQEINGFGFTKELGKGAWAVVYEGYDSKRKSTVAIKGIPHSFMKDTPKLKELVQTEIRVLKECHNQNVVRFVDSFLSEKTTFIAMEYCNGGDLEGYLEKKKRLTEDEATNFLKQIINGFKGLHEVNAMHRDFKVANVLLHDGICKIADLGFAKQLQKKKMTGTILGTSLTMAPELLRDQKYGMEADIWSLGVVYYQLLYGKYPFEGASDNQILRKIQKTKPDFSGVNLSANCRDFIQKCLTDNPSQRISWRQIYNHPLIKQQQKMIYGLASKINFKQGQQFYSRDVKIETDLLKQKQLELEKNMHHAVGMANLQKIQKQAEQQKIMTASIQKYQKLYLNKRNNVMFIFKFVTPYIYSFFNLKANHEITLFILCKKAYHQMKSFLHDVKMKVNYFKLPNYFNEFTNNQKYEALISTLKSDIDIIMSQMVCYKEDIENCNSEIRKQFDFDAIYSKNWDGLVNQTISAYEFMLAEGIDVIKGRQKMDLLKVIQALIYYKENKENAQIESFDVQVESMDYELEEVLIRSKLKDIYA